MKHPARWVAVAVAAVVVVLGVVLAANVGDDPQSGTENSPFVGKQVPQFDLSTLTGGRVSKSSVAGKVVIVNFWNTWCTPCQQELPALKAFYQQHAQDPDFVMIGILRDPQESDAGVKAYAQQHGMQWTIALDPQNRAALDFATRGQPETLAVSPSGVVAASQYGPMSTTTLNRFVAAAQAQG